MQKRKDAPAPESPTRFCRYCSEPISADRLGRHKKAITCKSECSRAYWRDYFDGFAEDRAAILESRRAEGLCLQCGKLAKKGRRLCRRHLIIAARHQRYENWRLAEAGKRMARWCKLCGRAADHHTMTCPKVEAHAWNAEKLGTLVDFYSEPWDATTIAVRCCGIVPAQPYDDELWRLEPFDVTEAQDDEDDDLGGE